MAQNQLNSLIATTSGLCGGLGKALGSHLIIANITIQGIMEVTFYAAISALVGFGVKKSIDHISKFFNRNK